MKQNRMRTFLTLAALLAVLLGLGRARQSGQATVSPCADANCVFLPLVANPLTYSGKLTDNGKAVANEKVLLFYTDKTGTNRQYTSTTTAADGSFVFASFPALSDPVEALYATFPNQSDRSDWLFEFVCDAASLKNPDYRCEINVHNVVLDQPADGATVSSGSSFSWTARSTPADLYSLFVLDSTTGVSVYQTSAPAYRSSEIVKPVSFTANRLYNWRVDVTVPGEGVGLGYAVRGVYFK